VTDDAKTDDIGRVDAPATGERVVPPENVAVEALVARGWTIAVAESLTAGAVTSRLCWCPGTEDRVLGGVVSYSTEAKRRVLGTRSPRVVSADAALEMACAVRDLFAADVGLSLTGVAGPERQEDQPVGTVFVAWSTPEGDDHRVLACAGTPEQIRRQAEQRALTLLIEVLGAPPA